MLKIYYKLPLVFQNVVVTIKYSYVYYRKYGVVPIVKPIKKVIEDIRCNIDIDLSDEYLVKNINNLTQRAIKDVPYYSERSSMYERINNLDDLSRFPVIKKEDFKINSKIFVSRKKRFYNSIRFKTSGTTGSPLSGYISHTDLRIRYKAVLSSMIKFGVDYSLCVGRFPGAAICSDDNVYRKDYLNNNYYFSISHISDEFIRAYYECIVLNKIEILEGYPSTIYSLMKTLKKNGYIVDCIKNIITTAEKLYEYQKNELEEYFACKVFDYYGSNEGSAYVYMRKDGVYINERSIGYVEVVDDDYNKVTNGSVGKMLVTCFCTNYMPLIRYDIGDYCAVAGDELNQNNRYDCFSEIIGRSEDIYITCDGRKFGRFSILLKCLPGEVKKSQLKLKNKDKNVWLYYESDEEIKNKYFKNFEERFGLIIGEGYQFNYYRIDNILTTNKGKVRSVIID